MHQADVWDDTGDHRFWQARCDCGWESESYESFYMAATEAQRHEEEADVEGEKV